MKQYHVMQKAPETVGGWTHLKETTSPKTVRMPPNCTIWTDNEYEEWYENNIMPYYRKK